MPIWHKDLSLCFAPSVLCTKQLAKCRSYLNLNVLCWPVAFDVTCFCHSRWPCRLKEPDRPSYLLVMRSNFGFPERFLWTYSRKKNIPAFPHYKNEAGFVLTVSHSLLRLLPTGVAIERIRYWLLSDVSEFSSILPNISASRKEHQRLSKRITPGMNRTCESHFQKVVTDDDHPLGEIFKLNRNRCPLRPPHATTLRFKSLFIKFCTLYLIVLYFSICISHWLWCVYRFA